MQRYTTPFWQGEIVEFERFWPIKKDGESKVKIQLAYPVCEVISLYDSRFEKEFFVNEDFYVEDGCIVLTDDSRIIPTKWEDIVLSAPQGENGLQIQCSIDGHWLFFTESSAISDKQYSVKYRHTCQQLHFVPKKDAAKLPKTSKILENASDFMFSFFGDSITVGANSSGADWINVPPYAPIWPKMVCKELERRHGCNINYINHSVGGKTSDWGVEEFKKLHENERFDLLLIAFGMNDGSNPKFEDNIRGIINQAFEINPDCEILLVSTMLPNKYAKGFYNCQDRHEPKLEKIAAEYGDKIALVPVTRVHQSLLKRKNYFDMTGNNVNHPNDFLAAVYAQTVLTVLD